ncbi:molybdenum ABC transporter, periplasmic molybdate-binding protein [Caulobacter sp. AP07]|uniref:molybdate ABC transporter substrate-binding protein n=1 Tax=Caulobacter sp. AP07 TaxID=1144304 RepID=UPI000271F6E5|nr:molybdate ABC transporter substrate-binding protein [Caulobacter sp. AP07]EJL38230.1 molybdenum ABC transporter, periplasmic molybdate-binding protein [Caulobacter sp. AP07]
MLNRRPFLAAALAGALSLALGAASAVAAETKVAVAANFTEPAKEIAARFEAATGHKVVLSFGSSGQFYTQIANGAPYEVFLSADSERPAKAEADGLAVAGTRFTYATGRLVLFSKTPGLVDAKGAVLRTGKFEKLAIADPKAAPYGQAAVETLTRLKLYDTLKPKVVTGASITQTYQYVQTGAAELGFVALSQVANETGGSRWLVPAADHTPIDQQAVLLKTGADSVAAKAFLQFLKGKDAKAIIKRYGYEVH